MKSSMRGFAVPLLLLAAAGLCLAQAAAPVRPPAVPLVTHDPYFSIWSMADRLTQDWP
jgi:ABC-type sugar transport system substrate-binding protein